MASLAGNVHCVVVQITMERVGVGVGVGVGVKRLKHFSTFTTSNATSIAGDIFSLYSTSASANAEPHAVHQCTGFCPRCKCPFATIFESARTAFASYFESIVKYGFCQSPKTPKRSKSSF